MLVTDVEAVGAPADHSPGRRASFRAGLRAGRHHHRLMVIETAASHPAGALWDDAIAARMKTPSRSSLAIRLLGSTSERGVEEVVTGLNVLG